MADGNWSKATLAIAAGRPRREPGTPLNVPPVLATSFHAGGARNYSRDEGTPTWEALEDVLGKLEGGEAVVFASGMGAVAAVFASSAWTAVVVPNAGYAGVRPHARDFAAARGIECTLVDITDTQATLEACRAGALLWLENPTNPLLDVVDLPASIAGAHERGATVAVDNTLATPLLQSPLALGADYCVHSVTKYLAGHSDATLGAAIAKDGERVKALRYHREFSGAIPGGLEAYLALRGIRTLPLRLERAQSNARTLAERLRTHSAIERVRYPGFGGMLSFEVKGGAEAANRLCDSVRLISHATSLGGVESSLERRAKYPGETYLPPGLIRMSVGCEDPDDLWNDLRAALGGSATASGL